MKTLLSLKDGSDPDAFMARMTNAGVVFEQVNGLPLFFIVDGPPELFPLADRHEIQTLEADSIATPDYQDLLITPDMAGDNWALARIIRRAPPWNTRRPVPAETFFDCVRDGTGTDIYLCDTGVDVAHASFGGRVSIMWSATGVPPSDGDWSGHGTGTMGCALADLVGVARGATGFMCRIATDASGSATTANLLSALGEILAHYSSRFGLNRPAVCSVSYSFSSSTVNAAFTDLMNAGMVIFGSAGNDKTDLSTIDVFPAETPWAICAGGINIADRPYYTGSNGTNWGLLDEIDISAPAQFVRLVRRTGDGGGFRTANGTSYAAPLAAGVVACMLQGHNRPTSMAQVQAIRAQLIANATTGKRVNAFGITIPDRILYLDPYQTAPGPITGL